MAVIGLGRMGGPIARRLAQRHAVTGWDLDPEAASSIEGVRAASSASDALSDAGALVTVLPGPSELRQALDEAWSQMPAGSLWVDLTSCDPTTGAELHDRAAGLGIVSVAAPMLGGPDDARRGDLGFVVGGTDAARTAAEPVLSALGHGELRIAGDEPRHAYLVKLLGNLLWFGQVVAVTEALLLAQRGGLDPSRAADVLAAGPGASAFLTDHRAALLSGDLMESFGLDRVVEELDHLQRLADEAGTPFALSRVVTSLHRDALSEYGPRPGELLASALLQERAGTTLSAPRRDPA